MFVGKVPSLGAGYWVGIKLDLATGDINGTIGDKQYFECAENNGTFVRPKDVEIGEYPPEDDFDEEEDMI